MNVQIQVLRGLFKLGVVVLFESEEDLLYDVFVTRPDGGNPRVLVGNAVGDEEFQEEQ